VLFYEEIMRQNSQMIFCCLYGKKKKEILVEQRVFHHKSIQMLFKPWNIVIHYVVISWT